MADAEIVNGRYPVDNVVARVGLSTRLFGVTVASSGPAPADVRRDTPAQVGGDSGVRFDT
jgi:hypothetical protein